MTKRLRCRLDSSIATITLDDGKVNALSLDLLTDINAALDRAEANRAVVVLSGREGLFSAGFDLEPARSMANASGPPALSTVILAEPFTPEAAVDAGFLDRVVPASELQDVVRTTAESLTKLDMKAHAASKLRARKPALDAIRAGIDADFGVGV